MRTVISLNVTTHVLQPVLHAFSDVIQDLSKGLTQPRVVVAKDPKVLNRDLDLIPSACPHMGLTLDIYASWT